MSTTNHQPCYGQLFPETLRGDAKVKVFSLQYVTPAGMMPRRNQPVLDMNMWDECTKCPEFENCHKLSMAKLAMAQASSVL